MSSTMGPANQGTLARIRRRSVPGWSALRRSVLGSRSARAVVLTAPLVLPFTACVLSACFVPPSFAQSRNAPAAAPGRQSAGQSGGTSGAPVIGTPLPGTRIVAVVNGDVITSGDVENRARLFALSTGLATTPEVIDRLKTQIANQLVDEKLRLQEAQKRKVVVPDKQIAGAIHDIEQRNNMPEGALRDKLANLGVSVRTLIDQIRIQLAWTQVLREQLAEKINISDAEVDEQMRLHEAQMGKPEYRVGEIFIPVDDPGNIADAQRFAETVIGELRSGAAFSAVAAQFSQTQTALEGGELGWLQPDRLDPQVGRLVAEMPVGAISNPVKVPGGFDIVTLQGKRQVGTDMGTFISLRQVFLPFTETLDPQHPTEQQRGALEKARSLSASIKSCAQMEQAAKVNPSPRAVDPGEVRLETVNPAPFRDLLTKLPPNEASQPLVAADGIAVIIICSKEQKNTATLTKEDVRRRLITDRVEMVSRQLMRDLRRKATIQRFNHAA
jgi:peptidyl-prolyl cis-trans isomerase SurA